MSPHPGQPMTDLRRVAQQRLQDAVAKECDDCGAAAGKPCLSETGYIRSPHPRRFGRTEIYRFPETMTDLERAARAQVCEVCSAQPGYPCRARGGSRRKDAHLVRRKAGGAAVLDT